MNFTFFFFPRSNVEMEALAGALEMGSEHVGSSLGSWTWLLATAQLTAVWQEGLLSCLLPQTLLKVQRDAVGKHARGGPCAHTVLQDKQDAGEGGAWSRQPDVWV